MSNNNRLTNLQAICIYIGYKFEPGIIGNTRSKAYVLLEDFISSRRRRFLNKIVENLNLTHI